jgi:hypothetical protein
MERELGKKIDDLLNRAEAADAREDAEHGKGQRGDDASQKLALRKQRLAKLKAAKAARFRDNDLFNRLLRGLRLLRPAFRPSILAGCSDRLSGNAKGDEANNILYHLTQR